MFNDMTLDDLRSLNEQVQQIYDRGKEEYKSRFAISTPTWSRRSLSVIVSVSRFSIGNSVKSGFPGWSVYVNDAETPFGVATGSALANGSSIT